MSDFPKIPRASHEDGTAEREGVELAPGDYLLQGKSSVAQCGSGLSATVTSLARVMHMLMNGGVSPHTGERVLKAETAWMLLRGEVWPGNISLPVAQMFDPARRVEMESKVGPRRIPGVSFSFGLSKFHDAKASREISDQYAGHLGLPDYRESLSLGVGHYGTLNNMWWADDAQLVVSSVLEQGYAARQILAGASNIFIDGVRGVGLDAESPDVIDGSEKRGTRAATQMRDSLKKWASLWESMD